MVSGTIYTYPGNVRAYKALIAAQYSGADVKLAPNFVMGETNKSSAFLKKFPTGKVPCFESADGECISESNAIAHYVANEQLRGKTALDQARVLQWMFFADNEVVNPTYSWLLSVLGIAPFDQEATEKGKEQLKKALAILNKHLTTRTFLVGERVTLADIVVMCSLFLHYKHLLDPTFRKPYQNVTRWFLTTLNQPQAKAVVDAEFALCEKTEVFDQKKFEEIQAALAGKKQKNITVTTSSSTDNKESNNKKRHRKKAKMGALKVKPEEKSETKPAKKEEAEEAAEAPADTSSFIMDEFKRVYSNEDESKSIPYFFEKFDPENYSIWFCEYKYNEELSKVFMSCNLIGGMYQRLEKLHKIAFASMCLFGKDNDSSISGVWVWKGHDLVFERSPDTQIDYESYTWKKLDVNDPSTKKLVEEYFAWTAVDSKGRKFNQGKIFK